MARELRRLLIARERLVAELGSADLGAVKLGSLTAELTRLALQPEERHYLERVLRYSPGDRFAVVDGAGHRWTARLERGGAALLEQPLDAPLQEQPQPRPALVLAAAVVRRDFEVVVRMAVELGADRLIPVLSQHIAVQGQLRPERWRSIAVEAAEQCERLWMPQIDPPTHLQDLLEPEGLNGSAGLRLWCTTRDQQLPALEEQLPCVSTEAGGVGRPAPTEIWLACGPEGGWSPQEDQRAEGAGWRPVQLGPRILRSSTACVAGLSALSLWRGRRFGC